MRLLLVTGLLYLAAGCHGYFDLNGPLINTWWTKLNKTSDGLINEDDLTDFLVRYHNEPPTVGPLECDQNDFTSGPENWINDFNTTDQVTLAYFRLLNVDDISTLVLTDQDTLLLFRWIDTDALGSVNEAEFKQEMPLVFRSISWAVMFIQYVVKAIGTEEITTEQFRANIFDVWDVDADGLVTLSEFDAFWQKGGYGNATTAQDAHTALDFDQDGTISRDLDLDELFNRIDDGDDILNFTEFCYIDVVVYGL